MKLWRECRIVKASKGDVFGGVKHGVGTAIAFHLPMKISEAGLIPSENIIEKRILLLRGQRVMLDADLAELYGVTTKRLNEQVKRNQKRFPPDFMFCLSSKEKSEVVANCDHLKKIKYSNKLPNAFTEHGALMLASVLNSPRGLCDAKGDIKNELAKLYSITSHRNHNHLGVVYAS